MAATPYTDKQRRAVIGRAIQAVHARLNGATAVLLGPPGKRQSFDLDAGGMCARFIRQCFETGLGITPFTWPWRGATAKATLAALKRDGYAVPLADRQPGDILGVAMAGPGHIVLYLGRDFDAGKELVAENTSATRGYPQAPGTKVTRYSALAARVKGCYRLFPKVTP